MILLVPDDELTERFMRFDINIDSIIYKYKNITIIQCKSINLYFKGKCI